MCKEHNEILLHMFVDCKPVNELWCNIQNTVNNLTGIYIPINKDTIILGYLMNDNNQKSINVVILLVKQYIFQCFLKKYTLHVCQVLNIIRKVYYEQEMLAKLLQYTENE